MKGLKIVVVGVCLIVLLFPLPAAAQKGGGTDEEVVWVEAGDYRYQVLASWLPWVYDPAASEEANETALIQIVHQIDPAAVAEAQPIIEENIPGFVSVALAPEPVGDDLLLITMLELGLSDLLSENNIPADISSAQLLEAFDMIVPGEGDDASFGYWLELDDDVIAITIIYIVQETDAILLTTGMMSSALAPNLRIGTEAEEVAATTEQLIDNNEAFSLLVAILTSIELSDNAAQNQPEQSTDLSQCPESANLGEINAQNTNLYAPFRIPFELQIGSVDVTRINPQPLELEPTQGTDFVFPLAGYVNDANCPDAYFTATPCPNPLECYVTIGVTAAGAANPTLLVRQPNGLYVFADIVQQGGNLDPSVAARPGTDRSIPSGIYEVWVGGHNPGETIYGELLIIVK